MYCKEYNEYEIIKRLTNQHKLNLEAITILYKIDNYITRTEKKLNIKLWNNYNHDSFNEYYHETIRRLNTIPNDNIETEMYEYIKNKEFL